eukprot:g8626.t1
MSFYRGHSAQASFVTESDLPIGLNDNIDQVQEERLRSMRSSSVRRPSSRPRPPAFRNGRDPTTESLWLPHETVTEDRCKANITWAALLSGAVIWVATVDASARGRRANPPVRINEKGFEEDAAEFTATLDTAASTATATAAVPAAPQQGLTAMLDPVAYSWCPVIPLSGLTIDRDGVASGEVQSLHASVYVLWSDEVAETPLSSTRQFINTFFLGNGSLEDAVLSRLPYDRVSIGGNGTDPFTFVANDVTVGLTEHVPLGANEDTIKRVHIQVATNSQQTAVLGDPAGAPFDGAMMFATFSINDFTFLSTEEYDPVDDWTLVGAAGGILAGHSCINLVASVADS